ncbi:hypothetical protein ACEA80_26435, partial [Escherichia coli]
LLRQKQKKLIMLPSETMIWQPEFTDKTLSRKPGAVQFDHLELTAVMTSIFGTEGTNRRVLWSDMSEERKFAVALITYKHMTYLSLS